ncbi:MAG: glycosyltransferase family 4 protein [Verrucomicrobiota bacterium]
MKISISATNPCHLYDLARALHSRQNLGTYYSGYPLWKLPESNNLPARSFSLRTLAVYSSLRLPSRLRPRPRNLFLWQDSHFDRKVARNLQPCDFVHAMPGQCLETFRRARTLGIRRVLNHPTGPPQQNAQCLHEEYTRVGMRFEEETYYDQAFYRQQSRELALADYHCVASSIVEQQLLSSGIPADRIWTIPYGVNPEIFHRKKDLSEPIPGPFRILFAGEQTLRKGVRFLLEAFRLSGRSDWEGHFYGSPSRETERDLLNYRGEPRLHFHGAVNQTELAAAMNRADVLILPSLEEGFGLVVVQALSCGLPCLVSDRVGASDLIQHHQNGSIFPPCHPRALFEELSWWESHHRRIEESHSWDLPAETLLRNSTRALEADRPEAVSA